MKYLHCSVRGFVPPSVCNNIVTPRHLLVACYATMNCYIGRLVCQSVGHRLLFRHFWASLALLRTRLVRCWPCLYPTFPYPRSHMSVDWEKENLGRHINIFYRFPVYWLNKALSIHPSVRLSIHPYICLSVCLSVTFCLLAFKGIFCITTPAQMLD